MRQSLRLHAFGAVHQQNRAFHRGQRTRDLVRKIHMARSIYKIEDVIAVLHSYGLHFDGDAAFLFQIHHVQILCMHFADFHGLGYLQQPIGQCGFAVIYVRDNGKISNVLSFMFHVS